MSRTINIYASVVHIPTSEVTVNWKLTVLILLRFLWSLLFVFQYLTSFYMLYRLRIQFTYRFMLTIQAESLSTYEGNQQSDIVTKKTYFDSLSENVTAALRPEW